MRHSLTRRVGYWATTGVTALVFASGGAAYLAGAATPLRGMAELGYPPYFVTLLGLWKLLGSLAIVAPRLPRLKEWAYAGIAFDLTGAVVSHLAIGPPGGEDHRSACFSRVAGMSWWLRPPDRRLEATLDQPRTSAFPQQTGAHAPCSA